MGRSVLVRWVLIPGVLLAGVASASDPAPSFSAAGVPGAASFVAGALGDGRFILYDGNGDIWIETGYDSGAWTKAGSGYYGDPGFIAVSPDGHTCLICAGYSGSCWWFDAGAPADAGTPVYTLSAGYWGAWLDDTKILVDRAVYVGPGPYDYQAELGILDFSSTPPVYRVVVANKGAASAAVCVANGYAYATDGLTGATNRFLVSDLLDAFAGGTTLAWPGTPNFGVFSAGGCSAVSDLGTLIFQGSIVQFVDETGLIAGTASPDSGAGWPVYSVAYNTDSGRLLVSSTDWGMGWPPAISGWLSDTCYEALPVGGGAALAVLGCALLVAGCRRLNKR